MSLLKVNNLVTGLHNGAAIVDGISFEIAAGETFALLGESGCGKSMTALSLMRLLPDGVSNRSGAVSLAKTALFDLPEREMRSLRGGQMAMIFQEPGLSLNPVMTVGVQIAEVLELHQNLPSLQPSDETTSHSTTPPHNTGQVAGYPCQGEGVKLRAIELLAQVGIPDAARRVNEYPFQLSGGMKQRVMIAMALAGSPKLLIADEPTTALDVTIQAQVLELLRDTQAKTGMAMLLITHDLGVVAETAHHVGVMYAGQIVEQASREALFAQPLHPYTKKLFAALPQGGRREQPLAAIPGAVPPLGSITQGCRFAPRCDQAWDLCREQTPQWTMVDGGRGVKCHLYQDSDRLPRTTKGQSPELLREGCRIQDSGSGVGAQEQQNSAVPPSILLVKDLQVHFPIRKGILQRVVGQVKAVDGVSLAIPKGRTLALVGESGCGKTTLGKALLQLIKPTAGSVQFDGRELIGNGKRASMQMVFQDPYASLNPKMRIAEILEEGMSAQNSHLLPAPQPSDETPSHSTSLHTDRSQIAGYPAGGRGSQFGGGAARQAHIDTLLDKVGLARTAKWRYPHEFSGGQRQRIAIARALAVSPQLLICDEPTSALDVSVQAQILNLIKELQNELQLSYLFITHNLAVVEYLAHEVCVMYLGRIVERGAAEKVLRAPRHPYTRALLSAVPRIDGQQRETIRLEGDLPSPAHPPPGCHFAPRCAQAESRCRERYPLATELSADHIVYCHLYGERVNSG